MLDSLLAAALVSLVSFSQQGGVKMPPASPEATASVNVLNTKISIRYNAPGVKGRAIWGKLVPYGEVWRLGANAATTVEFSEPVKIRGQLVDAGKYALFATPKADQWTIHVNRNASQWGSFEYKAAQDVVTIDVKPEAAPHTEYLNINLRLADAHTAHVVISWEKVKVEFAIEAELDALAAKVKDAVANAKPGDPAPPLAAAQFLYENRIDLKEALAMVNKAIAAKDSWRAQMVKADILAADKKNAEAIACLERGAALAKDDPEAKSFLAMLNQEFAKKIQALK